MGSTTIYRDSDTYPDGTRYEMVATAVPETEEYPDGVKYRFQYMAEDGRTLLRFDNFPHHPGVDRHHYHTPDGVHDDVEYTGLQAHVRKFHDEGDAPQQVIPMSEEPITPENANDVEDSTPGYTDDGTTDAEALAMADAEAGFFEEREPEEYPSLLRITSNPGDQHRREAIDRLERWKAGEEVPHVINFQNPSDLRALLTDRRIEVLRSIMADRPGSIRRLADRLERDVKTVHEDLQVLADYDVVHFERDGRAKRPFVPYDTIEVTLEISAPGQTDDVAPA